MIDLTYEERIQREAENLRTHWDSSPRWSGIERTHSAEDVIKPRGSITIEHTLARLGAERLWWLMTTKDYVHALGRSRAGRRWRWSRRGSTRLRLRGGRAADANLAGHTYPDQSLYPVNSVPTLVRRINNALQRADQSPGPRATPAPTGWRRSRRRRGRVRRRPEHVRAHEGDDRERRGGVHFEDQLASEKKCGHLGKVLVPTSQFLKT